MISILYCCHFQSSLFTRAIGTTPGVLCRANLCQLHPQILMVVRTVASPGKALAVVLFYRLRLSGTQAAGSIFFRASGSQLIHPKMKLFTGMSASSRRNDINT